MKKMLAQIFTGFKKQNKLSMAELKSTAKNIRRSIIRMLTEAKSGHTAGSLDMVEILVALYFKVLHHQPSNPNWQNRDRVILSHGHVAPALYATLAEAGYFNKNELKTLRKINSKLQGHPHYRSRPGIENTSGPLGQGLSQAVGVALALKLDKITSTVYCLMSDGEQQEGQVWEAYMYAGTNKLNNLKVLIDRNHIQITNRTEKVMSLDSLKNKLEAFNWQVLEVDGHSIEEISQACLIKSSKPVAIICHTVPGKGVSFMENDYHWHGKPPTEQEKEQALLELK